MGRWLGVPVPPDTLIRLLVGRVPLPPDGASARVATDGAIEIGPEGGAPRQRVWVTERGWPARIQLEDGEVLTKSPSVMKGYYHNPQATEAVMRDGWFCTGDLGRLDREGFLTITGRKKEIIVTSSGKKVTPRVVEELVET
ncbi:MAG: AMP-binding protein, partial [Candidatus Rokubacteria bacterium]|nr:AMP-binding protein [Candidatus Rokubacteria bacterium]